MLSYIQIGSNDITLWGRVYAAILIALGNRKQDVSNGVEFSFLDPPGQPRSPAAI